MAELTINTLIRIIIVLLVIVVVGVSLFLLWNSYLKPYFSGIGKDETSFIPSLIILNFYKKKVLKM